MGPAPALELPGNRPLAQGGGQGTGLEGLGPDRLGPEPPDLGLVDLDDSASHRARVGGSRRGGEPSGASVPDTRIAPG